MAVFCFFLNIAVKYLGKPRHWLIAEQSVLVDAFTYIILQLEPHKTQIWSVFFLNDYPLRCKCESSPCGNRLCIITFHKNSFWLKRTHGVDVRARTLESSENVSRSSPQRLRRIYPSGGRVSRKNKWSEQAQEDESSIWRGAACGKISQLWKLWQSCGERDKIS